MAFRALLVLVTFCALMYGCGQVSSPVEQQEKQAGIEEAKPKEATPPQPTEVAQPVVGNMPIAGIVGENVEGSSFDLRILDYFTADHYYYVVDRNIETRCNPNLYNPDPYNCHVAEDPPYIDKAEEATSQEGKFVVVNYSVTNTSPQRTIEPALSAQLHVRGADGKTEVYEQTDDVRPPRTLEDIAPQGLRLAQFIFVVPTEVEPELLAVAKEADEATGSAEEWVVDLRESDPQGPEPEEILALQYEYYNMTDFERVYDLFAQESKDRVSEGVYVSLQREVIQEGGTSLFPSYSFPYTLIEGDRATMLVVPYSDVEGEGLSRAHWDKAVLEDEGWRIVMNKGEYRVAKCWEDLGRLC